MDISVKALQEAISIRRQIDALEKRLASILGGVPARVPTPAPAPRISAATRAKLAAAARARWTRIKAGRGTSSFKKKGALTPAGRRRLSQLMKARWAARRKAAGGISVGHGPGPGRVRLVRS